MRNENITTEQLDMGKGENKKDIEAAEMETTLFHINL